MFFVLCWVLKSIPYTQHSREWLKNKTFYSPNILITHKRIHTRTLNIVCSKEESSFGNGRMLSCTWSTLDLLYSPVFGVGVLRKSIPGPFYLLRTLPLLCAIYKKVMNMYKAQFSRPVNIFKGACSPSCPLCTSGERTRSFLEGLP